MIKLSNAVKTYDRGELAVRALRGVSLNVDEGEFVAIMGASGSGKSTLLHILGLLDVVDGGNYRLFGRDMEKLSDDELAETRNSAIGFVFQHFNLLSRATALENVILPVLYSHRSPDETRAKEMLAEVGLGNRITHKPNELSGGQQQRVAIARALINNPRLILADEPTGNLDSASALEIMNVISALHNKGLTVVMVTHEDDIAAFAGRIIHMRDGVIQKDELNSRRAAIQTGEPARGKGGRHLTPAGDGNNHSGMKLYLAGLISNLRQACRAIVANKLRSALSMLGILIGVAAVIAMLAIGKGATKSIEDQLASMGSNLLMMRSGPPRHGGVAMSEGMITRFTDEDVADILREIPEVSRVAGMVNGRCQLTCGGKNWSTQTMGAEPAFEQMHASVPVIGRFFTADEVKVKARVALIGRTIVRELFNGESPLGEFMKINKINFQVIGVLPEKGATRWGDQDDIVVVPLTTAMDRLLGRKYLELVEIEIGRPEDLETAQEAIRKLIIRTHHLPPSRQESFHIRNLAEMKEALTETSRVMSWLLSAIAAVSMLVGGIGIMNIMLVSVTERTREIGVRKAVGAERGDIMMQFLTESLVISIAGGLLGIMLGWLISFAVSTLAGWASIVTLFSIFIAVAFSAATGVVFGIWPARKAAQLNPIDALRYE